jgi:hypothetical protein
MAESSTLSVVGPSHPNQRRALITRGATGIAEGSFKGVEKLKTVRYLGCNMSIIEGSAFAKCSQLRQLRLPKGLLVIADGMYDLRSKTALGAFSDCTALASVIIPATVRRIGHYAFFGTSSLQAVVFEKDSQLLCIGCGCFERSGLKWIELPATVTEIRRWAFSGCKSLSRVWSAGEAPASAGEVRWLQRVTAIANCVFGGLRGHRVAGFAAHVGADWGFRVPSGDIARERGVRRGFAADPNWCLLFQVFGADVHQDSRIRAGGGALRFCRVSAADGGDFCGGFQADAGGR